MTATPERSTADPRAACVAVAVLTARRAGVSLDVAALLDGIPPVEVIGGLIEVAEALLDGWNGDARLAALGLSAALRVHCGGADG